MNVKPIYQFKMPTGTFEVYTETPNFEFRHITQTHSCIILPEQLSDLIYHEGDGIIGSYQGSIPLAIKTADCMPILILGKKEYVFLHAGWKGLSQGILKSSLIKIIDPYFAFIGPSIQPYNFEVSQEFYPKFPQHQHLFEKKDGKHFFNLQQTAIEELKKINPFIQIQNSGICTVHDLKLRSFRREKNKCRNWNIYRHKE